jgi:DNA modification methylase
MTTTLSNTVIHGNCIDVMATMPERSVDFILTDTRLIQDYYLGHRKIEHTVKYTASNPARFERLWR